ncbi:hypothetical protein TU94_28320 [Streptomyces cyaneogriseus subsp. noncyanogenus]|uniref:SpdB2 protein n=1 Tax=Streptomyces cyaneogriseus subsp. noncyanogenus TaxID=477245 RepID=A0A0C5GJU0_9ACTN|nr:hypothetical protein [Streptomyces cyaneogriseus]AJP04771.1 hypothetical protein TU94_28320 [Streptomyces cyaneogriseus subsp. noncyanogenus]
MSSWFEERRADKAADAEQRRRDEEHRSRLRREEAREEKKERREEKAQRRRDKAARRQARAARREKTLTPGNVYRKGTLALVAASALASLPAQVDHFIAISWMLLPLPFALEGAAWVMNAGVAYADERKLPAWVRWLLRVLAMTAAGYAASINYSYGMEKDPAVGYGLAAVTMLGPLFFEVRQWVTTLTVDPAERKRRAEAKARRKHEKQRRKDHKDVGKLARQLVSAAPFGTLDFEDAFGAAWEIKYGTRIPGMTPALHAEKLASSKALADAMDAANGSPVSTRGRLLELLHPAPSALASGPGSSQVANQIPPASSRPSADASKAAKKGSRLRPVPPVRRKGDTAPYHPLAKVAAADTARRHAVVNGHHH